MNLHEYEAQYSPLYKEFAEFVKTEITDAIASSHLASRLLVAQARAKDPASLEGKLKKNDLVNSNKIETEIKDLAGVRLIFYTNADVYCLTHEKIIYDIFSVETFNDWEHYPNRDNEFAQYQARHYIVTLKAGHINRPDCLHFRDKRCEIQVHTLLEHAWAEMCHDAVYKAPVTAGFGTAKRQEIKEQVDKIMIAYLRPAGINMLLVHGMSAQLAQATAMVESGVVERLARCNNNDDRYETLSDILNLVLPNCDTLEPMHGDIFAALADCVIKSRAAADCQGNSFRDGPGTTAEDVTRAAINVLNRLIDFDCEASFRALLEIYTEAQEGTVQGHIITVLQHHAKYNPDVFQRVGAQVQQTLMSLVEPLCHSEDNHLRTLARSILSCFLAPEMLTIPSNGDISDKLSPSDGLRAIRMHAIDCLFMLFDSSVRLRDKFDLLAALSNASQPPFVADYSTEVLCLILADTNRIIGLLASRTTSAPYELLVWVERFSLNNYWRARKIAADKGRYGRCCAIAEEIVDNTASLRNSINNERHYVRFKTLVGERNVFAPHWDNEAENHNIDEITKRREIEAKKYITEVTAETADDWYHTIGCCIIATVRDIAAFEVLSGFLRQLAAEKPDLICAIPRGYFPALCRFLHDILAGLLLNGNRDYYRQMLDEFTLREDCLHPIAWHCHEVGASALDTAIRVLRKAMEFNEVQAVCLCLAFAIKHHDDLRDSAVERLFRPALEYLTDRDETSWLKQVNHLPKAGEFFTDLSPEVINSTLTNLVSLKCLDNRACAVLAPISRKHPSSICRFFAQRLAREVIAEHSYEAIPWELTDHITPVFEDVPVAVGVLWELYNASVDGLVASKTGWRLPDAMFPTHTDELSTSLITRLHGGSDAACNFVFWFIMNCRPVGPITVQVTEVIMALIDNLPADDGRVEKLYGVFVRTGCVPGYEGPVNKHRDTRESVKRWQNDQRPKVRAFTRDLVRRLDQRIPSGHRVADTAEALDKLANEIGP